MLWLSRSPYYAAFFFAQASYKTGYIKKTYREKSRSCSVLKDYEPGYVHIDRYQILTHDGGREQTAIPVCGNRQSDKVGICQDYASKSAVHVKKFLAALHKKAALGKTILTDNGKECTDRFITTGERTPIGKHLFDRLCSELGIDHRLIPAGRPQTNDILKRFNGRIADIRTTNRFVSGEELALCSVYNHQLPQQALGHTSPIHAMKRWYNDRPEIFWKKVRNTQRHDTY